MKPAPLAVRIANAPAAAAVAAALADDLVAFIRREHGTGADFRGVFRDARVCHDGLGLIPEVSDERPAA